MSRSSSGGKWISGADVEAALIGGVRLLPSVDVEGEVLDADVVVLVSTAVRLPEPQVPVADAEVDDLLIAPVGRIAHFLVQAGLVRARPDRRRAIARRRSLRGRCDRSCEAAYLSFGRALLLSIRASARRIAMSGCMPSEHPQPALPPRNLEIPSFCSFDGGTGAPSSVRERTSSFLYTCVSAASTV